MEGESGTAMSLYQIQATDSVVNAEQRGMAVSLYQIQATDGPVVNEGERKELSIRSSVDSP